MNAMALQASLLTSQMASMQTLLLANGITTVALVATLVPAGTNVTVAQITPGNRCDGNQCEFFMNCFLV
jgi:hypothetical protein